MSFTGWPVVQELNGLRRELFDAYQKPAESISLPNKTVYCFGHKVVSVITLPVDLIGVAAGVAGMCLAAGTLGAFKVGVFACTLGNVKPEFPIGFIWCAEKTVVSLLDLGTNVSELVEDIQCGVSGVIEAAEEIARKLHLSGIVRRVLHFVEARIETGVGKSQLCEERSEFEFAIKTPFFLNWINTPTSEYRISLWEARPLSDILRHSVLSVINIPLNTLVAVRGSIISPLLAIAFIGKSLLCAATDIDIPIPTAVAPVSGATLAVMRNVVVDIGTCVADVAVVTYKAVEVTGLVKVAAAITDLVWYIPQACFT